MRTGIFKTITALIIAITTPDYTSQKIQKLSFTEELQETKSSLDSIPNTEKIKISNIFYNEGNTGKVTYSVEGEGNTIRSQGQNPLQSTDFSRYSYANITLMKKMNDSSIIMIFDSQGIGVQHLDGNFTNKFGVFERGYFYEKGRDPDCHDFARDGRFNVVHVLCFFKDRTEKDPGLMMIYSIFDGFSVRGIKNIQLDSLVKGRNVVRVVQGKKINIFF